VKRLNQFLCSAFFINQITHSIHVHEQNFGRPSMIWQSRTSSNKGSIRGLVRCARVLNQLSGTSLNTNTGSIDEAQAHLCAHAQEVTLARTSGSVKRKLETHKHIFNRHTTGARTLARLCAVYPVYLSIGLPYKCLPLMVFYLKIFNWTFLLILIGFRRDPDQVSEEVLVSVRFSSCK